jgi:DNA mismatch repair protein MutL
MGKIIRLEQRLANMIAAGEVIERLGNVVKELVENSIDASATQIEIELLESGMSLIRVVDNGSGMDAADALLAFERHATSKIHSEYELFHLVSLGFRGEALASISAVAKVELTTSQGQDTGYKVVYQDGKILSEGLASPRKGTDISVTKLFYHTPARLKHLKSPQAELAYIVDLVDKLCLSHPEIAFHLTHNGKTLLKTNGNNRLIEVLGEIYGIDVIREMLPFKGETRDYAIEGMLASPLFNRSSKNAITVIVNGRIVKNFKAIQAVIEGLDQKLTKGRYPVALVRITSDPLLIDANIHPTKQEVKFSDEGFLFELIRKTIAKASESFSLVQIATLGPVIQTLGENQVQLDFASANSTDRNVQFDYSDNPDLYLLKTADRTLDELKMESSGQTKKHFIWPAFDYIGQYHGTYLLFQNAEGLYLIDQHAAAERIRYERYLRNMSQPIAMVKELMVPLNLNFSNHEVVLIEPYIQVLKSFGLEIEQSGKSSYFIRSIPTWFPDGFEVLYSESVIRTLIDEKPLSVASIRNELAILLACKHSIKANRFIDNREVKTLLEDLAECDNPHTCPHGRPIMVKFEQLEIEKWFKRVQ